MNFSLLINMKMPTIHVVDIFIFISREIFILSLVRMNLALLVIWDLLAWKISCSAELSMKKVLYTWGQIRLFEYWDWSESSLGTHVWKYLFWHCAYYFLFQLLVLNLNPQVVFPQTYRLNQVEVLVLYTCKTLCLLAIRLFHLLSWLQSYCVLCLLFCNCDHLVWEKGACCFVFHWFETRMLSIVICLLFLLVSLVSHVLWLWLLLWVTDVNSCTLLWLVATMFVWMFCVKYYVISIILKKNEITICRQWRPWSNTIFWVCTVCQSLFLGLHTKMGLLVKKQNPCPAEPGYTLPLQTV